MQVRNRQEAMALVKEIQARREAWEVQALIALVTHRLEVSKARLLVCPPEGLVRLQGEAQGYDAILQDLIKPIPDIQPKQET